MELLAWYNLIFYLPLGIGLLMILGMVFGFADGPHGVDLDGDGIPDVHIDAEGHVDHGHENDHASTKASFLGFGRVPMLLIVMTMLLIFGGTGVMSNTLFAGALRSAPFPLILGILALAIVVTLLLTGTFARIIARMLPTMETTSVTKDDFVGCTGTLILPTDARGGLAQVSRGGDLYQIAVQSEVALPKGAQILVVSHDARTDQYDVTKDPLEKRLRVGPVGNVTEPEDEDVEWHGDVPETTSKNRMKD